MNGAIKYDPIEVALEEDETLLVHAANLTPSFLETLDEMEVAWEPIPGCPWIQMELASVELQILMEDFESVKFDILA
jgi:hypothetical protein